MNDPTYEQSLDRYWQMEVDPCRRCAGIAPDVVCGGTKVRPFVGSAAPVVIVLAQDPTLRARPSTNVAMDARFRRISTSPSTRTPSTTR